MILRFSNVRVHNFFCFSDAELSLKEMGYSIVSGKNNMGIDGAVSNGSGKSSIFNAICFALTGETAQGLSNNVENIYTDPNDCWVEVEFTADNDEFVVRRYKTPRSDMKIYINGEDRSGKGIKESQQILSNYLPDLTSRLIGSIIILGQGLPYKFTYNAPSARKTILENLTKSDYMVQTIKDKLDARKEDLRQRLRLYEDKRVEIDTQRKIYSDRLTKLNKELDEYNECSSDCDVDEQLSEIEERLSQYEVNLKELNKKKNNLNKKINNILTKKSSLVSKGNELLNSKLEFVEKDLSKSRSDVIECKSNEKQLEQELKKIESIVDICPTCGQKIPNVHKIDTTELKSKLQSAKLITKSILEAEDSLKKTKQKIINDHNNEMNASLKTYDADVDVVKTEMNSIEVDINNINKLQQMDIKSVERLKHIQENYSKVISEIYEVDSLLTKLYAEKTSVESSIIDVNEHLRTVQDLITLAKREFRSALLVNVVAYMDKKAKEYSVDVFGNESLSIVVDDNYIDVLLNNKYYEALSGGEKQKVDIIIQLVLRDLLSNQLNIHSNILVLDEGLDFLDSRGSEAILNLIQNKLSDVESMFIISHHVEELNISYDTKIQVEKGSDGISNIFIY